MLNNRISATVHMNTYLVRGITCGWKTTYSNWDDKTFPSCDLQPNVHYYGITEIHVK
jgi:hypothetical protein